MNFTNSGWLAARRMGSNGHMVHTAAVFVTVNNAPVRASAADAQFYVQWMDNLLTKTSPGGVWNSYFPTSLSQAQARYQAAKAIYQQIASEAGGSTIDADYFYLPDTDRLRKRIGSRVRHQVLCRCGRANHAGALVYECLGGGGPHRAHLAGHAMRR